MPRPRFPARRRLARSTRASPVSRFARNRVALVWHGTGAFCLRRKILRLRTSVRLQMAKLRAQRSTTAPTKAMVPMKIRMEIALITWVAIGAGATRASRNTCFNLWAKGAHWCPLLRRACRRPPVRGRSLFAHGSTEIVEHQGPSLARTSVGS